MVIEPIIQPRRNTSSSAAGHRQVMGRTILTTSEHGTKLVVPVIRLRNNLKPP